MKKTIAAVALVALLAGCSGRGSHVSSMSPVAPHAADRAPRGGGPGTTTLTYQTSYAPYGPCSGSGLGILVGGSYPAPSPPASLNFPAGQGPQLVVSNCNFTTPQYVRVTLGTPAYGTPFIRQSAYNVTVDAPAAAQVTATWTALGPTLPGTPGATGTVKFTIAPAADSTVLWKTGDPNLGQYVLPAVGFPPAGDGQCGGPSITGSNASFTVIRDSTETYYYPDQQHPHAGASSCYRNQMNPIDPNTGTNFLLNMGQHYTYNFQTVVTLNGNYVDYYLSDNRLAFDLPAIVWQAHSYGGDGGACTSLVIDNTWKANFNNPALYPGTPAGGLPTWNFHTCGEDGYSSTAYNSPDTLHDGQVDLWQIDVTAAYQGHSAGSFVVQRNGSVVYSNQSAYACDSSTPECFWNFGPYPFYYETSEKPSGWNANGITVQMNDMTFTTPNGSGVLSSKRSVRGSARK